MKTEKDGGGTKPDSLPPWPSEPPATVTTTSGAERTSGLVLSADPRVAALEGRLALLEQQRTEAAELAAKMTADLAKLGDLARVEKTLRESSLVQIRRLAVLEREAEAAKNALASAAAERDELRARATTLEDEVGALRDAVAAAETGARAAAGALGEVTRALEVAAIVAKR